MAAKTDEERIAQNSPLCSPNKLVTFTGIVMVEGHDNFGKDKTRMMLTFWAGHADKLNLAIFNPGDRVWEQQKAAQKLHSLCEALGLDFHDIPHCKGGWHELIREMMELTIPKKNTELFAKITLNEKGYFALGEGVCFSTEPTMTYSDNDKHFILDVDLKEPTPFILDDDLPSAEFSLGEKPVAKKPVPKPPAKPLDKKAMQASIEQDIKVLGPINEDPDPLRRQSRRNRVGEEIDTGEFSFEAVSDYHKPPKKKTAGKKDDKVDAQHEEGDWLDKLDKSRAEAQATKPAWADKVATKHQAENGTAKLGKTKRTPKKTVPELVDPIPDSPREDYDEVDLDEIPGTKNLPY